MNRLLILGLLLLSLGCDQQQAPMPPLAQPRVIDETDLAAHLKAIDTKIGLTWPPTTPTPTPTPPPTAFDLQKAISNAASGSTLHIPSGTAKQLVTVNKPLTIIFDAPFLVDLSGQNIAPQDGGFKITASGVTLQGPLTIANSPTGGLRVLAPCVLDGIELANCAQEGFSVYQTACTFRHCHIHHNNPSNSYWSPGENGGGKTWNASGVLFDSCEIDHNGGTAGIWFDGSGGGCRNCRVTGCRVHHNYGYGIYYEVSSGGTVIDGNFVWENARRTSAERDRGAGINVTTSIGVEVKNNILAWNSDGVEIIDDIGYRSDGPGAIAGNYVHDNTFAMWVLAGDTTPRHALGFHSGKDAAAFLSASANNRGLNNKFWWKTAPATGYDWGGEKTLTQFQATQGGQSASLLTDAALNAALTAAGIPLQPTTR